jgi:phage terminase large subunit-like protein
MARPKQLPPHDPRHHLPDENGYSCGCDGTDTDYECFLLCAGRGLGKTLSGANNLVTDALTGCTVNPGGSCHQCPHTFAVVAPTRDHLKQVCLEGDSGILSALEDGEMIQYNKSLLMVTLRNGNIIRGFSAENEERYRGPNLSGTWVDELGVFRHEGVWHQMRLALRIGRHPRIYVTTTPRPTKLIRQLFRDSETGKVHITTGSTRENEANLSATMLESLYGRYGGTRMGRQELEGNLLEDIPGALWKREWFDRDRVVKAPADLTRVVVAMDPAVTTGEDSDDTGIIVAGQTADGHAYILADFSRRDTPFNCCRRAVDAYHEFKADCIVGEQNNGGDYIRDLVHSVEPGVAYRQVYATRGKATRAQPVSSLYEQGRVHHVGSLPELEDEMSTWLPDDLDSPDRMDATVWAISWLRDMFSGGWTGLYNTIRCEHCGQMVYRGNRDECPKCGTAFPVAA